MSKLVKIKKQIAPKAPKAPSAAFKSIWLWLAVFFVGGLLGGWLLKGVMVEAPPADETVEIRESGNKGFRYINPILECANVQWQELRPFRHVIQDALDRSVADQKIKEYAVYFRDLNNGWWFGVNEKTEFQQGSLIKVPLLMAFLRQAQYAPELLERKITCDGDPSGQIRQNITPQEMVQVGKTYTVDELLRRMIVYSDNNAMDTLARNTSGEEWFRQTYHDLKLPAPGAENVTGAITIKRYASFFRILYNASYLNREYSDQALQLLTKTKFDRGLTAGVPKGVEVAHKFGERGDVAGMMQLHDCGIVYHPTTPYLLCVMTRGENQDSLAEAIAEASRLVYDEVTAQQAR